MNRLRRAPITLEEFRLAPWLAPKTTTKAVARKLKRAGLPGTKGKTLAQIQRDASNIRREK
jgi:hypothetical protein